MPAPTFIRTPRTSDNARHESTCSQCSRRINAYTEQDLEQKQLRHKCRPAVARVPKSRTFRKVKLY